MFFYLLPSVFILSGVIFLSIGLKVYKPYKGKIPTEKLAHWYKKYQLKFIVVGMVLILFGAGGMLFAHLFNTTIYQELTQ